MRSWSIINPDLSRMMRNRKIKLWSNVPTNVWSRNRKNKKKCIAHHSWNLYLTAVTWEWNPRDHGSVQGLDPSMWLIVIPHRHEKVWASTPRIVRLTAKAITTNHWGVENLPTVWTNSDTQSAINSWGRRGWELGCWFAINSHIYICICICISISICVCVCVCVCICICICICRHTEHYSQRRMPSSSR